MSEIDVINLLLIVQGTAIFVLAFALRHQHKQLGLQTQILKLHGESLKYTAEVLQRHQTTLEVRAGRKEQT